MQIDNISIHNLAGIEEFSLEPSKLVAFVGKNGAGKTSVMEALRFGITGEGSPAHIRNGSDYADVSLAVFGREVRRLQKKDGQAAYVEGKKATQASVKKFFVDNAGVSADIIKVVTASDLLQNMKGGALAEFLLNTGLIPMQLDADTVRKFITLSAEAMEKLDEQLPEGSFGLDEIERIYTLFADNKKMAAREVRELKSAMVEAVLPPARKRATVQADIEAVTAQKVGADQYARDLHLYEQNQVACNRIQQQAADLQAHISELGDCPAPTVHRQELDREVTESREKMREMEQKYANLEQAMRANERMQETLDSTTCPLNEKLECKTDKTTIRDDLALALQNMEAALESAADDLKDAIDRHDAAKQAMEKWSEAAAKHRTLQEQTETLRVLLESLPEEMERPEEPGGQEDLAERLNSLQEELRGIEAYENYRMMEAKLSEKQAEQTLYELLVNELSPTGGVREHILKNAMQPLIDHCNSMAARLRMDFRLDIRVEDGIQFLCEPRSGAGYVALSQLSSGEKVYALFLILDMLNELSRFRLLLFDGMEVLDTQAFDALLALVGMPEVKNRYDHIFFAMVDHEDTMALLQKHRSAIDEVVYLEEGNQVDMPLATAS